jgi:hypothetical protein
VHKTAWHFMTPTAQYAPLPSRQCSRSRQPCGRRLFRWKPADTCRAPFGDCRTYWRCAIPAGDGWGQLAPAPMAAPAGAEVWFWAPRPPLREQIARAGVDWMPGCATLV